LNHAVYLIWKSVLTSEGHLQASSIKYNCTNPCTQLYTISFTYCILLAWSSPYEFETRCKIKDI